MNLSLDLSALLGIPELPDHIALVQRRMEQAVGRNKTVLQSAALRVVKGTAKRLRPCLLLAVSTSQGRAIDEQIIAACTAVEFIHLASLVHDDIIDNAIERHGQTSIAAKEGSDIALLVGDYLLALGLEQASSVSQAAVAMVARTFADMCEGQSQELADVYNLNRSLDSYLSCIQKKTATLISTSCSLGALLAGLPARNQAEYANYGMSFGKSYQLLDDLLDWLTTSKQTGKSTQSDSNRGIYTYPLIVALQSRTTSELEVLLKDPARNHKTIHEILASSGAFMRTIDKIKHYNVQAAKELKSSSVNSVFRCLQKLPEKYLDHMLQLILI